MRSDGIQAEEGQANKATHGGSRGGGRPALRKDPVRLAVEIERDLRDRLDEVRGDTARWLVVTRALDFYLRMTTKDIPF